MATPQELNPKLGAWLTATKQQANRATSQATIDTAKADLDAKWATLAAKVADPTAAVGDLAPLARAWETAWKRLQNYIERNSDLDNAVTNTENDYLTLARSLQG